MDVPVWDVTVFTKNRDRLLEGDIACAFLTAILADPQVKPLLSTEHFSVDGTLIEAWASMKSFRPKDGSGEPPAPGRNGERDFHGEKRSNETHASTTDPDARLLRKAAGQASKLCHMGHVLMENRNGLVVDATTTTATATAEREAAIAMIGDRPEIGRAGLQVVPHGTCADGEPQRPGRGCDNHDRDRDGRARSCHRDDRGSSRDRPGRPPSCATWDMC